ncbi:PIR protein [Plasmodium sp.]|nr:PIR protein [Plasmodium sp.]
MNEEAIKKYQKTHDPYEQLKDVVEKNGTKYTGGNDAEPMSTLEKELLETYEETFGDKKDIMLKSGMNRNDDYEPDDSSSCEYTDINNAKLAKRKGRDKYLKHLKGRCTRGIYFCSLGTVILTYIGLVAAKAAAVAAVSTFPGSTKACMSSVSFFYIFDTASLTTALKAGGAACTVGLSDVTGTATVAAWSSFGSCGIAALVLLILAIVLIILYIWLYRRRKRSWKHECKKHLCK